MRRSLGIVGSFLLLVAALAAGSAPVAGQAACIGDAEPNDEPSIGQVLSDELCVDGTLAEGDQDLLAWEVTPAQATTRWSFVLAGVVDAVTTLRVLRITSDPGVEPPTPDTTPVLEMTSGPDAREATPREDVLVAPGRHVVAVFRSGPKDGIPDASIDYHAAITRGDPLPSDMDTEPNDDAASGVPAEGVFSGSGDLAGTDDHIRWTPAQAEPDALWRLRLQVPLGASVRMTVTTSDGLAWQTVSSTDGTAVAYDLGPDPGGYDITLSHIDDAPLAWVLSADPEPTDGPAADVEPNDQAVKALVIDPARPVVRGRLATATDADVWRLTIDEALAARQLDLRLIAPDAPARQVCLTDAADASLQCRTGTGGVVLSSLLLPVGEYFVRVTGEAAPDAGYMMRLDVTSAPIADYESEPNDTPATATRFDAALVMRGRAEDGDADTYRLTVTGEPQLWQVEARGSDLSSLEWVDGAGYTLGTGVVADDAASATLYDLYLVPGEHRIRLTAEGGDYTLTATPMGPPDPNAEREPNDEATRANRVGMGDTRTGRLRSRDSDWYRFSLTATEHIAIDVEVPDAAAIVLDLETGSQTLVETRGTGVGQDIHYDALLPPGDYVLWLYSTQPSDQPYRLELRREDPFARVGDLEPNDDLTTAREVPPSGIVRGTGWGIGDRDWYRLPDQPGGRFAMQVEGEVAFVELIQGDTDVSLRQEDGGSTWSTDEAPVGEASLLVTALGDYTLRLPGAETASVDPEIPLGVELEMPTDEVAAWWDAGQHVDGTVRVTNRTTQVLPVTLDAWTSNDGWRVSLDEGSLTLEPGAPQEVPVGIDIPVDAWAGTPVAVAVRVTPADGTAALAWSPVTPTGEAGPVGGHRAWAIPDPLLGGLDVASVALGGVSDGSIDPVGEVTLHDGMAIGGGSLTLPVTDPVTGTTVDLAGDAAIPVAGIVIDPASGLDSLSYKPRGFELWLSEDGGTWTSGLVGEVSPLGVDQAFVLPAPVPARFARLAITSTWATSLLGPSYGSVEAQVAEWKVIAAPGVDPAQGSRDIADPTLGGHVVTSEPLLSQLPDVVTSMLDEDPTRSWTYPPAGATMTWVVGFLHDRAAQVTGFGWADPDGSDPSVRARRVTVEVSTDSPLGPWTSLGTWRLARADDGSVAPFLLDAPAWARFVRFSTPGPRVEGGMWELPGRISILERATDETYRSILAEWGQTRPEGPYELLAPERDEPAIDDPDVGEGGDARPLAPDERVAGRVAIGSDVDEYLVDVPDGRHSIDLEVDGEPVVGVRLRLIGPDGADVPLAFTTSSATAADVYRANVTPGTTYHVRVEQPPFSAVMMYDTSLSIAGYWGPIRQGLTAFAGDVVRGRDRVMIIPFGANGIPLLRDWSDDAWQLQAALEGSIADGDSSTEASVLRALEVLEARQGARAILLVTDGETGSFDSGPAMWQGLARQRPLVFAVHIGGSSGTFASTHLLQDIAASAGGVYTYVRTQEEMDRAFDRMATTLRRPAGYSLSYATSEDVLPPPDPGGLSVVTAAGPDGVPIAAPVDSSIAIEIILDTSSSMRAKLGRTTRIDAAKAVLTRLVREELPPGIPVALRWFRQAKGSCDTELAVPLGPLDREAMASTIDGIRLRSSVRTPLAAAIEAVAGDLASVTGPRIVVVVSDGQESCKGDPAAAVRELRAQGYEVTVNVVGLGLSKEDRKRIRRLATLGGGSYFDARGAGQLEDAIVSAVSAPFEVRDTTGELVGRGVVNGPALELPPGTYRVTVLTEPPYEFEAVVLESGGSATLTLPSMP